MAPPQKSSFKIKQEENQDPETAFVQMVEEAERAKKQVAICDRLFKEARDTLAVRRGMVAQAKLAVKEAAHAHADAMMREGHALEEAQRLLDYLPDELRNEALGRPLGSASKGKNRAV